jgi:hypothetical protein
MSHFMRYGRLHADVEGKPLTAPVSNVITTTTAPPPGTKKAPAKKDVIAPPPSSIPGAKPKNALKLLIAGKPTEKDVR